MQTYLQSESGHYGEFGGQYLPELLVAPAQQLSQAFHHFKQDPAFNAEFHALLRDYAGRATPLTYVPRFRAAIKGPRIFLKREDLLHTGAHKLNNALGQCLLAKKMGKTRIIAETGAGQHGVATATACAHLGLVCRVYMGRVDMQRQATNVARMKLLGAEVVAVDNGSQTLKEAVNEGLHDWAESFDNTHYCLGSALGPEPYPDMVATFQSVIGAETKQQCQDRLGRQPDYVVACVGGGSNAIGIFSAFLLDPTVKLVGVEAGGTSLQSGKHAARFQGGSPGVLHGCYSYVLQDEQGQVCDTHSISAGLDYPMVGPQHADLFSKGRAHYSSVSDDEAIAALQLLSKTEGIIPALESAHALAYVVREAPKLEKESCIVISVSGRGDKDLSQLMQRGII